MKLILLNGPPGSGKDFAARTIRTWMLNYRTSWGFVWEKFSFPNKLAFAATVGAVCDTDGVVEPYERHKDAPVPAFGVSYRQWQIDFSETFMKPMYGDDIFAKLFIARTAFRRENPDYLCVVSDCGFQVEFDTVVDWWNPRDVILVRLHRKGHNFSGDSRQYVQATIRTQPPIESLDIYNLGDITFNEQIIEVAKHLMRG